MMISPILVLKNKYTRNNHTRHLPPQLKYRNLVASVANPKRPVGSVASDGQRFSAA